MYKEMEREKEEQQKINDHSYNQTRQYQTPGSNVYSMQFNDNLVVNGKLGSIVRKLYLLIQKVKTKMGQKRSLIVVNTLQN